MECIEARSNNGEQSKLELEIIGFGSSAPLNPSSREANCEFANMRAEAVAIYLAGGVDKDENTEKWRCAEMGQAQTFSKAQKLCKQQEEPMIYESEKLKLIVKQWEDAKRMEAGKPASDGDASDGKSLKSELFNRSVHIRMPSDFCLMSANGSNAAQEENDANSTPR